MKLPRDVNGSEAVKALRRLGYVDRRPTGSHVILRKESRTVVVPMHRPIKPGTLRGLIEQAGVTVEAFCAALSSPPPWSSRPSRCRPCGSARGAGTVGPRRQGGVGRGRPTQPHPQS